MIPIGSTIPLQRTPWVTFVVMAACTGLFGFELYQQYTGRDLAAFFAHYGWVPARFSEAVVQGRLPRLLPLLSSIFLHGGWTHLIGNLFFLYVFGRHVEDRLGAGCYVLFFCFGGVAAMLVQTYVAPFSTVPDDRRQWRHCRRGRRPLCPVPDGSDSDLYSGSFFLSGCANSDRWLSAGLAGLAVRVGAGISPPAASS